MLSTHVQVRHAGVLHAAHVVLPLALVADENGAVPEAALFKVVLVAHDAAAVQIKVVRLGPGDGVGVEVLLVCEWRNSKFDMLRMEVQMVRLEQ